MVRAGNISNFGYTGNMVITWYGNACFGVETRERGVEPKTLLFFPHDRTSRSHAMEERAAIIVAPQDVKTAGQGFHIDTPGEYEMAGFMVHGIQLPAIGSFSACMRVVVEGMRVAWMAAFPGKALSDKEIDEIGEVDVLLLPLNQEKGGKFSAADAEAAVHFMNEIEPHIAIPFARDEKTMKVFLEEAGVKNPVAQEKLVLKQKDLPEETSIILLKA